MTDPQYQEVRICQVIKGLGRGGAERLLLSAVRNLPPGWKVTIVYYLPYKSHLAEDFRALGCDVQLLSAYSAPAMLLKIPQLVRLLREKNISLIHAHLPWSGIVSRLAGRITGIPVVYTEHNLFSRYRFFTRLASRMTFRMQDAVLAVSGPVEDELAGVSVHTPVRRLINAVDTQEFIAKDFDRAVLRTQNGIPVNAFVVGTVTALTPQKRIDRWIGIAMEIKSVIPEAFFVIAGDGILREQLEQLAAPLLGSGSLLFTGRVANPINWLAAMDVFMMTSDFEGLPIALLEAMSIGCVPVCTPAGGIPSVLSDGQNGMLFGFDEPPVQVAAMILKLQRNHVFRQQLSGAARATVEKDFHISRFVAELIDVYRSLLDKPRQ